MNTLDELNENSLEALSFSAMADFCKGYCWMFEKHISCSQISNERRSADQLRADCKGIIAINNIAYGGAGNGMFKIIFDKAAIFSLGGATVMFPPMRIKEDCVRGNEEDARALSDAVGEIGNLIAGSFNKILREGCPDAEGLGDDITLHLRLPVPVGTVDLELETASYNVFAYKFELEGLEPFNLKVVFPDVAA